MKHPVERVEKMTQIQFLWSTSFFRLQLHSAVIMIRSYKSQAGKKRIRKLYLEKAICIATEKVNSF